MVDIHSVTAEVRRGKKRKKKKKKKQDRNIMSASATQGGHKKMHCHCTWTVQWYLPGCTSVHPA